jgi:FHA domain
MGLNAQLHITEAGRPDRIVALRGAMTIGRDSHNDVVLESISVSRFHAVLVQGRRVAACRSGERQWRPGERYADIAGRATRPGRRRRTPVGPVLARYVALYFTAHQQQVTAPAPAS